MKVRLLGCVLSALLATSAVAIVGCGHLDSGAGTLLHELKPHRLWRWNRQSGSTGDRYYAVDDPLPEMQNARP